MSNKKSRKFINIMLSAMMLLGVNTMEVSAEQTTDGKYGKNGVAYILLSSDFGDRAGVYRMNNYDATVAEEPWLLFNLQAMNDLKVSGLAANQKNQVFLLTTKKGDKFVDAPVGWLPRGIKFDEESPIYLKVAGPTDGGAKDYIRAGHRHIDSGKTTGSYWHHNYKINNQTYNYAVTFGGPNGVKYLNGKDDTLGKGTPVWDGVSYYPNSKSNVAVIAHPNDDKKIILPSCCAAISYYLYGTTGDIAGKPMDGSNAKQPLHLFTEANGAGVYSNNTMFGCIVKRMYEIRDNMLDLYAGNDTTTQNDKPKNLGMSVEQENVLKTTDVKIKEAYGKICGDNCIPGDSIDGADLETLLSTVTVVTSTNGTRYGFNPLGNTYYSDNNDHPDAALRKVNAAGSGTISTSDANGNYSTQITNRDFLSNSNPQVPPSSIKTIGVSSNYTSSAATGDFIYGSAADRFVVQDSWWGRGGVAYEYYKADANNAGRIVKIDYTDNPNPNEDKIDNLGDLKGDVDGIAIDGDGYLYALKTEQYPTDSEMEKLSMDVKSLSIDSTSYKENKDLAKVEALNFNTKVSGWKRDIIVYVNGERRNQGTIDVPAGEKLKEDDYKIVTIKQGVYKSVKRYPLATGALGDEEDRGSLFAGFDSWKNRIKVTSSGAGKTPANLTSADLTWGYTLWQEEVGSKVSTIPAELAVVNVADSPKSLPGTETHQVIVIDKETGEPNRNFGQNPEQLNRVVEDQTVTFKVEGYKPYIGGRQRDFRDVGTINNELQNVKLNSIPAEDGTYKHNENEDNEKSGFPSNMFEATGKTTTVKWHVLQVENTSVEDYQKQARTIACITSNGDSETVNGEGKFKSADITFKQPGRYIVQAEVTYHFFNNFGEADRPSDLKASTKTIKTEPLLIHVSAKSLNVDATPTYITNISLNLDKDGHNKKIGLTEDASKPTTSDFDCLEGKPAAEGDSDGKFGDLTITFDAQFFREEQSYKSGELQTHDGIGVWDYEYYKKLYENAPSSIKGIVPITIPSNLMNKHVYNYLNDGSVTTCYSDTVYNPGKAKATETAGRTHEAGTQVTGDPTDLDKQFIQYALYLRPVTPQGKEEAEGSRGALIKSGTFEKATFTPSNVDRKYSVSLTINDIDSCINTPRDPQDYTLDLEIIYPRVAWLNNSLGGKSDGNKYYSSIVPYTEDAKSITGEAPSPVHVLTKLTVDGVSKEDPTYNVSTGKNDSLGVVYKDGQSPSFTLCVRDKDKPQLTDNTPNLPYLETTGEELSSGNFLYTVKDNNPFLSPDKLEKDPERKEGMSADNAKSLTEIAVQVLKSDKNTFRNEEKDKVYKISDAEISVVGNTTNKTNDDKGFYSDDEWRLWIDYNAELEKLSPAIFEAKGTPDKKAESIIEKGPLNMENWIGSLSYAIVGKVHDGYGKDGKNNPHYFYDEKVYNPSNDAQQLISKNANIGTYPKFAKDSELGKESIESKARTYLQRFDNDPASIEVELISQSDNRRWVYQLIEGITDKKNCAKTVEDLSKSTLIVKNLYLRNSGNTNAEEAAGAVVSKLVDGTTNFYDGSYHEEAPTGCDPKVTVTSSLIDNNPIPSFRRAARLLINVNIFDNCGFKPLSEADIKVKNGSEVILAEKIKCDASHSEDDGALIKFDKEPRGVFVIDLPMKVADSQPQMELTISCKDHAGNERILVIPFNVTESTFETRVLETKEERQ